MIQHCEAIQKDFWCVKYWCLIPDSLCYWLLSQSCGYHPSSITTLAEKIVFHFLPVWAVRFLIIISNLSGRKQARFLTMLSSNWKKNEQNKYKKPSALSGPNIPKEFLFREMVLLDLSGRASSCFCRVSWQWNMIIS